MANGTFFPVTRTYTHAKKAYIDFALDTRNGRVPQA